MHVTEPEDAVGGRARNRVHEEREVARLRHRSLAAVSHARGQETANAVVVRCPKERAPHVGLSWLLLAVKFVVGSTRAASRDILSRTLGQRR